MCVIGSGVIARLVVGGDYSSCYRRVAKEKCSKLNVAVFI